MDEQVKAALAQGNLIDITTTGRTSGQPRRKEIRFHVVDGSIYLTGTPGKRSWYANLLANPLFTLHLKRGVTADLTARAEPIKEPARRRQILERILTANGRLEELESRISSSPLVAVSIEGA